jgi:hypothetical protein
MIVPEEPTGIWTDPIIEDLHRIREDLATRFNFDIQAIVEDIRKRQNESGHPVVSFATRKTTASATNPS